MSTEYKDTVESLYTLTDDMIFFSELLVKDLIEHGNEILNRYKKIAKVKKEKIITIDFEKAHEGGLMPPEDNYREWLNGFKKSA